ncbi:hypothetical protein Y919_02115 [Caloranaerobacter azorensis H53214]|uniref:DUF5673 domain-containing protein n=1 Tax=Caloranaerobacter azorensis H53214 TaxID=1156417 RepID=A0A096DPM7_9FIRM|nr:permease prefix domain 1-containing protein [Caloranaerobacter azorensis]KGG81201.1 hypothetical protein Y919_02115 [Caloranaerobacter azorensis H53214]
MDNDKIKNYVKEVCKYIKEDDVIEDIKNELNDHILTMTEDYIKAGYSKDESVDKAIKQMGDAKIIGRELNKAHCKKKDYFALFSFFMTLMLNGLFIYHLLYNNINSIFFWISTILIVISMSMMCYSIVNGYLKTRDKDNIIYCIRKVKGISSFQTIFRWFFGFYISISLFAIVADFISGKFDLINIIVLLQFSIIYMNIEYSYRKPVLIYEDGISNVKWEDIKSYTWIKSHRKKGIVYELKLNLKKPGKTLLFKVNEEQIKDITKILNEKGIK